MSNDIKDKITSFTSAFKDTEYISLKEVDLSDKTRYEISDVSDLKKVYNYTQEKEYFVNNLVNSAGFGDRCDFIDMDIDTDTLTSSNISKLL